MDQATATLQQRISHLAARPQTVGKADGGAGKPPSDSEAGQQGQVARRAP